MKTSTIILSALTAFVIGMGSSIITAIVEAKGAMPSAASWLVALFGAAVIAAKDNRALMKLPQLDGDAPVNKPNSTPRVGLWLVGLLGLGLLIGCAKVQPGADPIVVRTEQLLTTSEATFKFVLQVDNSDREFWKQHAPEFHNFAETLRVSTPYLEPRATNLAWLPQYRVWLLSTDDVKLAYKSGRASSNTLASFNLTLTALLDQAQQWTSIVSNRNPQPKQP